MAGDDGNLCGEGWGEGSFIKSRACCKSSGRMQNNDGVQTTLNLYYHLSVTNRVVQTTLFVHSPNVLSPYKVDE